MKARLYDVTVIAILAGFSYYAALVWITAHPGWTVWK